MLRNNALFLNESISSPHVRVRLWLAGSVLANDELFLNESPPLLVGVRTWPAGSVLANNALFVNGILWVPVPG